MTPAQIGILAPALSGFHQDFDLDDATERDILVWHARGLEGAQREDFYFALDALLRESLTEEQFCEACVKAGAHHAPGRSELESFLNWARTTEGSAEIAAPGPMSYSAIQMKYHVPGSLDDD